MGGMQPLDGADVSAPWSDATRRVGGKRRRVAALQMAVAVAATAFFTGCGRKPGGPALPA